MARINLLPWREELREQKNKEFITLLIFSFLFALAVAFATWTYFSNTLQDQLSANEHITLEINKLDSQLAEIEVLEKRRSEMVSRMQVVQDLQGKRPIPVRVWDDIARAVPKEIYLVNFKREGDMLIFKGRADNPNIISALVTNLDASNWLQNSKVNVIKQDINAYETKPIRNLSNEEGRPIYPEDSYIDFEVTTQVVSDGMANQPQINAPEDKTNSSEQDSQTPNNKISYLPTNSIVSPNMDSSNNSQPDKGDE